MIRNGGETEKNLRSRREKYDLGQRTTSALSIENGEEIKE